MRNLGQSRDKVSAVRLRSLPRTHAAWASYVLRQLERQSTKLKGKAKGVILVAKRVSLD